MKKKSEMNSYISEELNPNAGFWVKTKKRVNSIKSRYQNIELIDTHSYGLALRIDDYWMTSEKDEFFYHENMVHPAAVAFGAPKSALIIGGGDGGAAEEYLKYQSIKKVVLAELDEEVINFCKEHLRGVHNGAFDDPRLDLKITDGKKFVENTAEKFDLMMLDLTDPFGPAEALYRAEFLKTCKRVLGKHGVLSIHLGSPVMKPKVFGRMVATLRQVFEVVRPYMVYVPLYGTWWGMATASDETDPVKIDKLTVENRISENGLNDLNFYNSDTHFGLFSLPNFIIKIINDRDLIPITESSPLNEYGLDPSQHEPIRIIKDC